MKNDTIKPTSALTRRYTTSRRIPNPGVTQLRKDADTKIKENSQKIAQALVNGATAGNASSARLLVDLADNANWTEHTDAVSTVISLALSEFKKEPQNVELTVTQNPAKQLTGEQRCLTDGKSGIPEAQAGDSKSEILDAEVSDCESDTPDAEVTDCESTIPDAEVSDCDSGSPQAATDPPAPPPKP